MREHSQTIRAAAGLLALLCVLPMGVQAAGEIVLPPGADEALPVQTAAPTPSTVPVTPSPVTKDRRGDSRVLVGLCYDSSALAGANLKNNVGSGYRFGYLDEERNFVTLGATSEGTISVVKTQNVCYGYNYGDAYNKMISYSDTVSSDVRVGCWHVQVPVNVLDLQAAQEVADSMGGFPAWIDGGYQVRMGAYWTQAEAQAAAQAVGGTVVGTSAYGVSVVKTGTDQILFQFDGGEGADFTVMPGQGDEEEKTTTWFKGNRYYGGFMYRRIKGGNLTVINVVDLNDYISCVLSQEMSASWPIEALKAQAVCARTYYETNLGTHKDFDICYTVHCQAYSGMGLTNARTEQATLETEGLRAWYNGKLAQTFYFSSDGGGTEDIRNVWPDKTEVPYLRGVVDPYEETISDKISYWGDTKTYTASQLNALVQPYMQKKGYNCAAIVDFQITELSPTGNVKSIAFTDANGKVWPFTQDSATNFRGVLGLRSIRYTVTKSGGTTGGLYHTDSGGTLTSMNGVYAIGGDGSRKTISGNPYVITSSGTQFLPGPTGGTSTGESVYTITSYGWGHSVGMSQWGAYAMAQQGKSFRDILTFYYPGIEIY